MKSIKIEFIFLFVTLFAGIIANTGIAKESEIRKDSHALGYPYPHPSPYPYPNGTVPKVIAITRASANPTAASTVIFKVTFSEGVAGVDTKDFFLKTTNIAGAFIISVTSVTPIFASVHTVTVNTGNGNGTIRLDLLDNDSIVDASGNKLGGSGANNGNFRNGEIYMIQGRNSLFLPLLLR